MSELQEELGLARQRLGTAEGALAEMRNLSSRQEELVGSLRRDIGDRDVRLGVMERDLAG